MSIWMILKVVSALATVATGLFALVKPTAVYGFTGLTANGVRGVSEIRAIFGGITHRTRPCAIVPRPRGLSNAWNPALSGDCRGARILHRIRQIHRAIQPHQPGH